MTKKECFYGIYPIKFIWRGQYSDPLIRYKNFEFNYWDVENRMYEEWLFNYRNNEPNFETWIRKNGKLVKQYLDNVINIRLSEV